MLPVSQSSVQALPTVNRLRTLALLVWLVTVSACGSLGPTPSVDLRALQQQAEGSLAAGELEQSLRAYTQLVEASTGSTRSGFLIAGADVLLELGIYGSTRDWLTRAGGEATPTQQQQILLLLARLEAVEGRTADPLERVALLLPLSSAQRQAARAIQDGFMAAHLSRSESAGGTRSMPALQVYDTGLSGAREAYLRAAAEGADFIVGPLLKPELEEIIGSAGSIPTLTLNSLESGQTAANLYQFALAPEDEAREVVRYAVANGTVNAVALVPGNQWGDRLLNSFRLELETLGGRLLQFQTYDSTGQDFSTAITTVLNIDRSEQRRRRLAANLGIPLAFESRRRQDVDAIFLAADAGTGRLLAPQLRFHFAGDIPTYATSAIHESLARDADLNGLLFADTPWVLLEVAGAQTLKAALHRYWPLKTSPQWTRFYGLGFDAYQLIPRLYNRPSELTSIPALSGELSIGEDGRVRRQLPLAQFRNGRPVAVGLEAGLAPESPIEFAELR